MTISHFQTTFFRKLRHLVITIAFSLTVLSGAQAQTPTQCGATSVSPEALLELFRNQQQYPNFYLVCAHRGFWTLNSRPQNSFTAFQEAIDWGLDCVENDIRKTKDGQYVIFHDAKMDVMLVNKDGTPIPENSEIGNFTLAQLQNLSLRDRLLNKTAQRIQTLDEHLDQIKGNIIGNHELKDPSLLADKNAFLYLIGKLKDKGMLAESIIKGKLLADDYEWVLQQLDLTGNQVTYTPKFFNDPSITTAFLQSEVVKFRSLGIKAYELVITSDNPKNDRLKSIIPDLEAHNERYGQFDIFPESGRGRYKAVPPRNEWDDSTPNPNNERRGDWDWIFSSQNYSFMVSDRPCLLTQYLDMLGKRNRF